MTTPLEFGVGRGYAAQLGQISVRVAIAAIEVEWDDKLVAHGWLEGGVSPVRQWDEDPIQILGWEFVGWARK